MDSCGGGWVVPGAMPKGRLPRSPTVREATIALMAVAVATDSNGMLGSAAMITCGFTTKMYACGRTKKNSRHSLVGG